MMKKDSPPMRLVFEGRLTVEKAAEMKKRFMDALKASSPIEVDLQGATEIDITFFQLLFAAHKAAIRAGTSLSFPTEQTPVVQAALRDAGLCRHAGLCSNTAEQCVWTGGDSQ